MEPVTYDFAKDAPVEDVLALYRSAGWWDEGKDASSSIPAAIRGSLEVVLARTPDGRVIGMGRALSDGASDAWIQDIVVLPAWRGRGIGREIVARLARRCRERGIGWVGLVAVPGTSRFYASLGFRPLPGEPMILAEPGETP